MVRKDPPQPLSAQTNSANNENSIGRGPQSATSLKSSTSPTSPKQFFGKSHSKSSENIHHQPQGSQTQLPYPETSMMPHSMDVEMSLPDGARQLEQPKVSTPPGLASSPQKNSFFGFNKSKSSNKLQQSDTRRPATRDQLQSRENEFQLQHSMTSADIRSENRPRDVRPQTSDRALSQNKSEPQLNRIADNNSENRLLQSNSNQTITQKKSKPKGFNLLRRTNSTRNELDLLEDGRQPGIQEQEYQEGVRTAPIREDQDTTFREALKESNTRTHSADRQRPEKQEQKSEFGRRLKDTHRPNQGSVSLPKEASTSLMGHIKGAGSKAKDKFFGKSSDKGVYTAPEQYVPKLVNLPLIEQTRATRISKLLETSRDKTEYWMPSLPWRCIDYLNYRGTDQEGLYRVPGSGREITRYQARFDNELDVDLFQERELYDINIIGSLLKWWLRELPDELFPKEAQSRVARVTGPEPAGVPQVLIDELSNLPPYNYYLLFALTCHLSLILEHSDKNRMTMQNLTICFLPAMKMDATCFKLLVQYWKDCWKGCHTETEWMSKEIKWREGEQMDLIAPPPLGMRRGSAAQGSERSVHERNVSINSDSRPATARNNSNDGSRNISREENSNASGHHGITNSGSNSRNGNGHGNGSGVGNTNGSGNSSRERQQPLRLREQDSARLQTPPDIYVPPGSNGRHDQLLDPIQPMSPMDMMGTRQG